MQRGKRNAELHSIMHKSSSNPFIEQKTKNILGNEKNNSNELFSNSSGRKNDSQKFTEKRIITNFNNHNISSQSISEDKITNSLDFNNGSENLEGLPTPSFLKTLHTRNGTNIRGFQLSFEMSTIESSRTEESSGILFSVLYIVLSLLIIIVAIIVGILLARRYYSANNKDNVVVVRSLKNEREQSRRKNETIEKLIKLPGSPVTLNSESNLQTVKVKTLAITVRNKLEEEGTEV